jgi:glycosyltransferase involved in cell wall biosynthesis
MWAQPHRILHVITDTRRRGAQTFAIDLDSELRRRGADSRVVALATGASDADLDVPTLGTRRFALASLFRLRQAAERATIVVGHGSSTLPTCTLALAGTRARFVYVNIGDPLFWAGRTDRRLRVGWMLRHATAVAAVSPHSAETLIGTFGVRADRVHVIPNGRDAQAFPPASDAQRAAAREDLGLRPEGPVAAYVGALSPEKHVDVAIHALATLPDLRLVVAGDGPQRSKLQSLARAIAPDRVIFLGSTDEPARVLAAADLVVLTSASEGVPGLLIEAGLAGLPAVATDVGFVRDLIRDGETGLLVPPGAPELVAAAVADVLADRRRLGRAAREHCLQHFSLGTAADGWERLLADHRLLAPGRPTPVRRPRN